MRTMFEIVQTSDTTFEVRRDGVVIETAAKRELAVKALAKAALATLEPGQLAAAPDGALAERWVSGPDGICMNADTGDGRNFTDCTWTWRDPNVSLLPLMLQTTTDISHYGAVLAGWMDTLALLEKGGVSAGGWFYDTDAGRQFRDLLRASSRFGVSVDPGQVEWEDVCTEMDPDGFYCVDGYTDFLAYEIIGLTGTPFPGFATCYIELDGSTSSSTIDEPDDDENNDEGEMAAKPPVTAVGGAVVTGEPWRFSMAEPRRDDARYIDQGDGRVAIPLTITDDGHVFAHGACWGTCHIGYRDECVEPPPSPSGYAQFHLGAHPDAGGLATGVLVVNCDHAARNHLAHEARDHYAHVGLQWADVRATDGEHGIWLSGQLRPGLGKNVVDVLRASCLSGDWRSFWDELDMVAMQSVSVPGFPVRRQALAAAGDIVLPEPSLRARRNADGKLTLLAGAGLVRPGSARTDALTAAGTVECEPCMGAKRRRDQRMTTAGNGVMRLDQATVDRFERMADAIDRIDRRTKHLNSAARDAMLAQLSAES